MQEQNTKRTRATIKSHDERRKIFDARIAYHTAQIARLEAQKLKLGDPRKPRTPKDGFKQLINNLKASGMTPDDLRKLIPTS